MGVGLEFGLRDGVGAEIIGSQDQIQIDVADAGPALAINGDQRIHVGIGSADGLLHARVQIGIVDGIELLIGEEGDFGLDAAREQGDLGGELGAEE